MTMSNNRPGSEEALTTTPVKAGPWTRAILLLAFLAPSVAIGIQGIEGMLTPRGASPNAALSLLPALLWALLMLHKSWRSMLIDIGRILLARMNLIALLACSLIGLLLAPSGMGGAFAHSIEAWLVLMAAAKISHMSGSNPRQLRRQLIVVGINLGLLAALEFPVKRYILPAKSHNNVFVEHDSLLGWKLRPGTARSRKNDMYVSHETVNALGFRTPLVPFEKPAGTKRVVVLGDSHTEGYTVDDDETYCAQLQRLLSSNEPVEVISLGVGGFSTDQEYLTYIYYGRRFDPDLVLLQVCSNDLEMNVRDQYWRGRKPVFERQGSTLLLTGVPVPNLRNTGLLSNDFFKRSSLLVLIEGMLRQFATNDDSSTAVDSTEAWHVTDLLVRDLAALVRSDGARFAAFNANTRNDPEFTDRIQEVFVRQGVPYLETDDIYTDPFDSYWYAGHWNQKGQTAGAAALAPQIAQLLSDSVPTDPTDVSAKNPASSHSLSEGN